MGKEFLTFEDIEIEKNKFLPPKDSYFLRDVGIENWHLTRFLLVKKAINTLLVTCIMVIKLNH